MCSDPRYSTALKANLVDEARKLLDGMREHCASYSYSYRRLYNQAYAGGASLAPVMKKRMSVAMCQLKKLVVLFNELITEIVMIPQEKASQAESESCKLVDAAKQLIARFLSRSPGLDLTDFIQHGNLLIHGRWAGTPIIFIAVIACHKLAYYGRFRRIFGVGDRFTIGVVYKCFQIDGVE